jgi:hypothetical protein
MKSPNNILTEWLLAVNNGEMSKVLSLYNKNAVLIPTFSNRILNSPAKIRDYFKKLNSREKLSVNLHENLVNIQKITDTVYSLSGIYLWRFTVEGELLGFEARFSFVLDLSSANPIIHHHSSQIPRML